MGPSRSALRSRLGAGGRSGAAGKPAAGSAAAARRTAPASCRLQRVSRKGPAATRSGLVLQQRVPAAATTIPATAGRGLRSLHSTPLRCARGGGNAGGLGAAIQLTGFLLRNLMHAYSRGYISNRMMVGSITASAGVVGVGVAYFLLFGRFLHHFSPKTGVNWVNLAEKSGHILCNWQWFHCEPRECGAGSPRFADHKQRRNPVLHFGAPSVNAFDELPHHCQGLLEGFAAREEVVAF